MKTRLQFLIMTFTFCTMMCKVNSQSLQVSPELKKLIDLSVNRDRNVAEKEIDKQITEVQQRAVRSAFIPKLEVGGKYMFAYSTLNSKIGNIEGLESIGKLQELMKSPAFPVMFPSLASLTGELTKLQTLLTQQGIQLPSVSGDPSGDLYGSYFGVDATATMLLYSGGQVSNIAKALTEKIKAEEALSDKSKSDVISEVIIITPFLLSSIFMGLTISVIF